jgi:hypothetical protein
LESGELFILRGINVRCGVGIFLHGEFVGNALIDDICGGSEMKLFKNPGTVGADCLDAEV